MATITGTFNSLVSGTISGVFNNTAGGVLSGIVGTPGPRGLTGATGPAGPAGATGAGVAAGGTTGQYLVKTSGLDFATGWQTLDLSAYATQSWVTSQGYITASALSPYLTSATAASTYAVIAAGQPTSGTVGQVLTKNSGTNYDSSWQTLIPGDRYLTTSSTSNAVSNGAKTFTVSTGLSYTTQQDVTIAHDATHHMHAVVTSYDSGTGVLVVDVQQHTGTGTFTSWTINVGGTVPLQSVAWGDITGTLGSQSDLATALNNKLEVTTAASTYYLQTNPSGFITSSALTGYATESWVNSQGFATLTTTQKDAVTNASVTQYVAGSDATMSYLGGTFTFHNANYNPADFGGYVQFYASTFYAFSSTGYPVSNWLITYPQSVGETIANLVSWFNANYSAYGSISYAGDDTQSIDNLNTTTGSSGFAFPVQTLQPGDTFLIAEYLKTYMEKWYLNSGIIGATYPVLTFNPSIPNELAWKDLELQYRSLDNNNFTLTVNFSGVTNFNNTANFNSLVALNSSATATTQAAADNSTKVATTAFVKSYKPSGSFLGTRYFTTVGTSTYTPTTGTNFVIVEVIGGGGGANGFNATSAAYHTGGGGSGGYGKKKITTGFSGVTITVGAAGTAGASGTLTGAGNGGTSSFGTALTCTGGSTGGDTIAIASGASTGGAAGSATGSDFAYTSAAGSTSGTNAFASGKGGDTAMGYGQAGFPGVASSASTQIIIAQASYGYGSGASGHARGAAAASAIGGTAGRQGLVIVHEYT